MVRTVETPLALFEEVLEVLSRNSICFLKQYFLLPQIVLHLTLGVLDAVDMTHAVSKGLAMVNIPMVKR